MMQCPKCDGELEKKQIEDVEVDQCNKCSGIWFDLGELEKVMDKEFQEALKSQVDNSKNYDVLEASCPRCLGAGKMIPVVDLAKGIHIDTCTVCYGHWLDGGEYEKLKSHSIVDILKSFLK